MIACRIHGLAVLSLMAAPVCLAQSPSPPADAAGRPVRDRAGMPLVYDTAPANAVGELAPAPASPNTADRAGKPQPELRFAARLAADAPAYAQAWRTASFGQGIGATGIRAADLDSDGDNELVLGGGSGFGRNAFWSIVDRTAAGDYRIAWQSSRLTALTSITALGLVEAGGEWRVWIGQSDGRIEVVNAMTREVVAAFTDTAGEITDFAVADADNDGTLDVLAAAGSELLLYEAATPAFTRAYPYGGAKVGVGNVDADDLLEVVVNTGQVLEIDGSGVVEQWSTGQFGARIELGDIDGDGMAELAGAEPWYTIRAWDLDTQSLKWSVETDHDIAALRLIDVTDDGVPELLYGDGQWGSVYALDAASRQEVWHVDNPEHGVTVIAYLDADGDGEEELLWGAGWSSTGPDYLYVHDPANDLREWQSTDYSGPYHAIALGDVDADGGPELVVASWESDSGYADGLVFVFDAASHALEWRSEGTLFGGHAWTGVHDLELADVDADPQLEIVVGTDRLYDGALYVIDGLTHEIQGSTFLDQVSPLDVLATGDLTGDSVPEVVAGSGQILYAFDALGDAPLWQSGAATGFFSDVSVADVGLSGIDLIAAAHSEVHAVRWSDKRHLTRAAASEYLSVAAGNVAGTEENEILAGRADGTVDVLDGETLSVITGYEICAEPVTALAMQAPTRLLATCGSSVVVYDLDAGSALNVAASEASDLGYNGSLATGVVNGRAVALAGGSEAVQFVDSGGNQLPVVAPASATLHWRGETDLLLSASDGDGDPLSFELVTRPALGTAVWLDRHLGELRYTAGGIGTGPDTFAVRASDGFNYSATQAIELTLGNGVPAAETTALELHWRGAQAALLVASDPDGDPLSFELLGGPSQGSAVVEAATGVLTYTPAGAYVGPDSLSYAATDGADTATETVDIVLTNTEPGASSRAFDVSGSLVASRFPAEDADDDPLTYAVVAGPTQGELSFDAHTGLFEYTPDPGGSGTDSVTFEASDGIGAAQGTIDFRYLSSSPPPGNDDGGGGGGGGSGWLSLLLAAAGLRRLKGRNVG